MAIVLFADDEPWYLQNYPAKLKEYGHVMLTATNAKQALEKLESEAVDVIVIDIMMPSISLEELLNVGPEAVVASVDSDVWTGVRLYQTIAEKHPEILCVIRSVIPEQEIKLKCPKVDFKCSFLRKNASISENHFDVIRELLDSVSAK